MAERIKFLHEEPSWVGKPNRAEFWVHSGMLWIELEHPWDGDSESGFGREMSHTLTLPQAAALHEWLGRVLAAAAAALAAESDHQDREVEAAILEQEAQAKS